MLSGGSKPRFVEGGLSTGPEVRDPPENLLVMSSGTAASVSVWVR